MVQTSLSLLSDNTSLSMLGQKRSQSDNSSCSQEVNKYEKKEYITRSGNISVLQLLFCCCLATGA